MKAAFTFGKTSEKRFRRLVTLILSVAGTGKTWVSACITNLCLLHSIRILIFAPLHQGLNALENEIKTVQGVTREVKLDDVYRVDLELGEHLEQRLEANETQYNESCWQLSQSELNNLLRTRPPNTFRSLLAWIDSRTSSNSPFSLGAHIKRQLERHCNRAAHWREANPDDHPETVSLSEVMWYHALLENGWSVFDEVPERILSEQQQHKNRHVLGFRGAVASLIRFYITKARAVFCPVMASANNAIERFEPKYILLENASSMTELVCLNAIARHDSAATKIVLTGDPAQSTIILMSWRYNEFHRSESVSLFGRLRQMKVPRVHLNSQYRMSPAIHEFVSEAFYFKRRYTFPDREASTLFQDVMADKTQCPRGSVYFLSVTQSSVWQQRNTFSIINPEYVCCVVETVEDLLRGGIQEEHILILSEYSEERRVVRQLFEATLGSDSTKKLDIRSTLSSNGIGKTIVIWSTTRSGVRLGLASIANRKPQCLALSRAMYGLIIVGCWDMH
ncbi:AAA domain-containing protein [Aspergillus undulatus]|uniref:AAA domain-containing protein n=1 Tax=Aspergillus undulatus TaxID=1810928 RepID=UPI003CCDD455